MPEFFNVLAPIEALDLLRRRLTARVEAELEATTEALGRVLAQEVRSPEDLPSFARSAMDGYAVCSRDTFGATEGLPAYLEVVGEVPMGQAPTVSVSAGQAAKAYTGGMLAQGADAVVMVEHTQPVDDAVIEVTRPVAPGENVLQPGEDVRKADLVLPAGHVVRPQDVGGLLALGITHVTVSRRPRLAIVSSGDELVAPDRNPGPGQVRDINTYTLATLATRAGAIPMLMGVHPDDYEAQREAGLQALREGDLVVFSAGSSVSSRDMTARVIGSLGTPGVLAHGISFKPGKPTILGLAEGKPVFGLPGNPVSALLVFDMLVRPAIYWMCGCPSPPERPTMRARLTRDVASTAGREDHVSVRLVRKSGAVWAEPVFGKSNLIYTLIRADGTIVVPLNRGGLYAGEEVEVRLF